MFIILLCQFSDQSLSHNPCTYNQHWLITMTILKHARAALYQSIFLEPQDVNVKEQSCNKNVFTREIKLKLTPLNKISLRKIIVIVKISSYMLKMEIVELSNIVFGSCIIIYALF